MGPRSPTGLIDYSCQANFLPALDAALDDLGKRFARSSKPTTP
ncbi:hypothetical protein [Candidatus Cyanaurora vandensis]|nr:hypothetical protein [Candidatus Cyanaurora vandensis]